MRETPGVLSLLCFASMIVSYISLGLTIAQSLLLRADQVIG